MFKFNGVELDYGGIGAGKIFSKASIVYPRKYLCLQLPLGCSSTNKYCSGFKRKIPTEVISKAFILAFMAACLVGFCTLLLCIFEPDYTFEQLLFEVTSAFGTVGLTTGITPDLSPSSEMVIIITMFIGRVGPLTIASLWSFRPMSNVRYSEETLTIG
jgi:trk system potassium uptake protein TrkH